MMNRLRLKWLDKIAPVVKNLIAFILIYLIIVSRALIVIPSKITVSNFLLILLFNEAIDNLHKKKITSFS